MGTWEEVSISYREIDGHYCACCGKQVPRYVYLARVDGITHHFCGLACADLYEWYWLPRYGRDEPPAISRRLLSAGGLGSGRGADNGADR